MPFKTSSVLRTTVCHCSGDCIRDHREEFGWEQGIGKKIAGEIASGLSYLHSKGKRHQDIKTANIFVSRAGVAKIADMGLTMQMTLAHDNYKAFPPPAYTEFYAAPEIVRNQHVRECMCVCVCVVCAQM